MRQFKHPGFSGWIGAARADITPPPGIYARNWGAAEHDAARGVHRPLFVTALAIRESADGDPLVIVDADLGWWRNLELERRFRRSILEELKLDESRFLFALAHTHAAPPLTDQVEQEWEGGEMLVPYLEQVREATIDAASRAIESARPATLEWHTGRCGLAAARDLLDPADHSRRICGFDPDAEADDTLVTGRVSDESGNTIAVISSYACHPTTLAWDNELISPDFVGAMRETIESDIDGALALFLQGASGELAPRYQYVGDPAVADGHGRELGHAVLSTLSAMEPPGNQLAYSGVRESGAPLAVWKREACSHSRRLDATLDEIELPLKDWPSAADLEVERAAASDRFIDERLRRKRDIRRSLGDGEGFPLPVWIWRMGDGILVANMCEGYSWIQRELRSRYPGHAVVYMNLANGSIGYLPPRELYGEDLYQVWQTPFAAGSLEKLEAGIRDAIGS
jgi:hypothetical protein